MTHAAGCAARVAVWMVDRWSEKRLVAGLEAAGICVECVGSVQGVVALLQRQGADLVVVEDHGDGVEVCLASLRFRGLSGAPVAVMGHGSAQQIVQALSQGASDYLCMADDDAILRNRIIARIALSRHRLKLTALQVGDLVLDAARRGLKGPEGDVTLTAREFELAWVLFEHPDRVVNLHVLSQRVWGRDVTLAKRTIEQHVSRLRQKLALVSAACQTMQLQAVQNIGYRLVQGPSPRRQEMDGADVLPAAA